VLQVAKSARDIIYGIDGMYHHANRGTGIGGWTVLRFEPGLAELEKNTPHLCALEEGILSQALQAVGTPALMEQTSCIRDGAGSCRFIITSTIRDARWTG
jgi:predicted ArsR family transcriptional regulator